MLRLGRTQGFIRSKYHAHPDFPQMSMHRHSALGHAPEVPFPAGICHFRSSVLPHTAANRGPIARRSTPGVHEIGLDYCDSCSNFAYVPINFGGTPTLLLWMPTTANPLL